MSPRRFSPGARVAAAAAVLAAVTLVAYIPALRAEFIFDDDTLLTANPLMRAPDGIWRFWWTAPAPQTPDYWPMTSSTLWLEYRLWGTDRPWGYHTTNVLLHIAGALLVWRVLRRLGIGGAYAAALIFAVHPVCTASVAWVSERKNVLSMLFFALAVLMYLRFDDERRWRWYIISAAAFALALLSKTSVVVLPAALGVLLWWRRGRLERRDLLAMAPLAAMALAMGIVTVHFQHSMPMGEEHIQPYTFVQRAAGAGAAVWFYLYKALVPVRLTMVYPRWDLSANSLTFLLGCAGWVGAAACMGVLFRKRRTAWGRAALAAGAWYLVCLLPVLGFVEMRWTVYSLVADHLQYLAIVGIIAACVAAGRALVRRLRRPRRRFAGIGAAVLVAVLSVLTFTQARAYRDQLALWEDVAAKNPGSFLAWNNLGSALQERGRSDEAVAAYRRALGLNPNSAATHFNMGTLMSNAGAYAEAERSYLLAIGHQARYAAAHKELGISATHADAENSLGVVLEKTGRPQEAAARYAAAIRGEPDAFDPYNNLGRLLVESGRPAEGASLLRTALRLRPESVPALFNLALAIERQGYGNDALALYGRVLKARPDYTRALNNAGVILARLGRHAEAIPLFERALRVAPDDAGAHNNLGLTLMRLGRTTEALPHFLRSAQIDHRNTAALFNLSLAYMQTGRPDQAAISCSRVLAIDPNHFNARTGLAAALDASGRTAEAAEHFRLALKSRPNSPQALGGLALILATDTDAGLRNGAEAVRLAEQACKLTGNRSYTLLDTLAAAYAEAGQFADAVKTARLAADLAAKAGDKQFAQAANERGKLYQADRPWRRKESSKKK